MSENANTDDPVVPLDEIREDSAWSVALTATDLTGMRLTLVER